MQLTWLNEFNVTINRVTFVFYVFKRGLIYASLNIEWCSNPLQFYMSRILL